MVTNKAHLWGFDCVLPFCYIVDAIIHFVLCTIHIVFTGVMAQMYWESLTWRISDLKWTLQIMWLICDGIKTFKSHKWVDYTAIIFTAKKQGQITFFCKTFISQHLSDGTIGCYPAVISWPQPHISFNSKPKSILTNASSKRWISLDWFTIMALKIFHYSREW